MTRDQELWGVALALLKRHGDQAPVKVAERIGELATQGQFDGVALWQDIARHLDRLLAPPEKPM
ncbi:DUF6961 family protein [Sphingobium tyrosinilyticum]|uniref:DUF6961 family protein n=1 Tax=Sphingobium tyrosinilyticum TaxID=2715436 RepID=A0ABV9F2U0_9SPHN